MDDSEKCIIALNLDGYITYLSPKACQMLGFQQDFFTSRTISVNSLIHRDHVSIVYNTLVEVLAHNLESKNFSFDAITNFGNYVSLQAELYLNDRERPTNFVIIAHFEKHNHLLEQEDLTCQLNDQGIFLVVSPQCLMILGWRPYELLGASILDFLEERSRESFYNDFKNVITSNQGEHFSIVYFSHKEKGYEEFLLNLGHVNTANGSIVMCTFKQTYRRVDESNSAIHYDSSLNDGMDDSTLEMEIKTEDLNPAGSSLSLRSTDSSPTLLMANLDLSRRRFSGSDEHLELGHRASLKKKSSGLVLGGKVKLGARKSLEGTADTDGSDKKKKTTGKSVYRPSKRTDLVCEFCNATESPEWRRGPAGTNNRLCNACGIKYAKKEKQLKEQKGSPLDDADRQKLYENLLIDHKRQRASPIV